MNPEKVYLVETPLGLILLDDQMKAFKMLRFESADKGRKLIKGLRAGKVDLEIIEFLGVYLKAGFKLVSEELELTRVLAPEWGEKVIFEAPSQGGRWARNNPEKIAAFFSKTEKDVLESAREFALKDAEEEVVRASTDREKALIEAVKTYDTVTKSLNELTEKFRDWSELIWPGLLKSFKNSESALKFIASYDRAKEIGAGQLAGLDPSDFRKIKAILERTEDVPSSPVVSTYAATLLNIMDFREKIAKHIEKLVEEISPNVAAIAGPSLAAKLITRAGGVLELAKLPSSTIQVLGAEKALFRALKLGVRPPKHGIIFQHPLVHSTPRKFRGKVARVLASKISLAAKMDAFRGEDLSEGLKRELKVKVDKITQGDRK